MTDTPRPTTSSVRVNHEMTPRHRGVVPHSPGVGDPDRHDHLGRQYLDRPPRLVIPHRSH